MGLDGEDGERRNGRSGRRRDDQWAKWDQRVRDIIILALATGGVINELFFVAEPRSSVLVFLAGLLGVPIVMAVDKRRSGRRDD